MSKRTKLLSLVIGVMVAAIAVLSCRASNNDKSENAFIIYETTSHPPTYGRGRAWEAGSALAPEVQES